MLVALGSIVCADLEPRALVATAPQFVTCNFIVFFQTGSYTLDTSARQEFDDVASVASAGKRARIQVAGHTPIRSTWWPATRPFLRAAPLPSPT